jgi:mono/diheme cytochrome c family protein
MEEGSQGIAPELLPPLTWVGEKLHTDWMRTQFLGQLPYKPREWLKARMPGFPRRAAWLASGMVASHGYSERGPQGPALDPALAKIGGELVRQNTGFFCIECHAVGPKQAVGAFSHHGVNFAYVADRVHYDYYRRWITNPTRVNLSSKMPRFSTDGVTTAKTAFFDGDAQQQFDALWQYLLSVGAN